MTKAPSSLYGFSSAIRLLAVVMLLFASLVMAQSRAEAFEASQGPAGHCAVMMAPDNDQAGHNGTMGHGDAVKGAHCAMACACIAAGDLAFIGQTAFSAVPRAEGISSPLAGIDPILLLPPPRV